MLSNTNHAFQTLICNNISGMKCYSLTQQTTTSMQSPEPLYQGKEKVIDNLKPQTMSICTAEI